MLGAALIAGAFLLPVTVPYAPLSFGLGGFTGGTLFASTLANIGLALTLVGVSEMLTPLPEPQKFSSEEDPQLSFNFSGVQNTSRAGTPVPIVYGEIVTGSVVISAAIDTNQVDV